MSSHPDPADSSSTEHDPAPATYLDWGSFLTMGLVTAVSIGIGLLLGYLVDRLAGTSHVFLFVGLLIGIAGAVSYNIVKIRTYLSSQR